MDGIILINKDKGLTSRDVVNLVGKKLGTKKIGHTGTLDPLATGLLVLCVGEGTKLVELLTGHDKEYIAKVKVGFQTDTYDITGKVLTEKRYFSLDKEVLITVLNSFLGEYLQEVPIYSSVKVHGKKLYEYARQNIPVELPKHMVKIKEIELLNLKADTFSFKVSVSSGTYIRSLINDIGKRLNLPMTMEELTRTKVGEFTLENASNVDNLQVISLIDAVKIPKIEIEDEALFKKISNGAKINNVYKEDMIMFTKKGKAFAIYREMNNKLMQSYRIFNS